MSTQPKAVAARTQLVTILPSDLADLRADALEVARYRIVLRDLGKASPPLAQYVKSRLKQMDEDDGLVGEVPF